MKRGVFCLMWVLAWPSHAAVYAIESGQFTEVYGEYTTLDNVNGVVVTNIAIPQNAGLVDVSGDLESYSFSDGVQQLDETNSVVLAMSLGVNSNNDVVLSAITVWKTPVTNVNGGLVEGMDVYNDGLFAQYFGFKDGSCIDNSGPSGTCTSSSSTQSNSGIYVYFDQIFFSGFDF
ncbi:hypothetical protein [Marinicella meishanensis]|uniref:hypothetical protein n=1 Tax=Marinicella meishanensis TaxID=2873263 RepID=UPI001CBB1633|nr:hypothetical protein [Marinicella sp. NBU2979]